MCVCEINRQLKKETDRDRDALNVAFSFLVQGISLRVSFEIFPHEKHSGTSFIVLT